MTLEQLIAPVAAATVLNVFLLALAWRAHQMGATLVQVLPGIVAYGGVLLIGFYASSGKALITFSELLFAALGAQALGASIIYGLLNAFVWRRGQLLRDRAGPLFVALLLSGIVLGAAF